MKESLIKQCVKLYSNSLNKSSKFYNDDLKDYEKYLQKLSIKDIKEKYGRISALNSKSFENECKFEVNKMIGFGCYDMKQK